MTWFEVYIPAKSPGQNNVTLTIEGQNWMDALRTGLANIGEGPISNIMCDIQADNSIHVTDVGTQRVFRLRETVAPSAQPPAAPPPTPVATPPPAPAASAPTPPPPPAAAPTPAPAAVAAPAPTPAPAPAPAPAETATVPAKVAKAPAPTPAPAPKAAPAPAPAQAKKTTAPVAPPPKRAAQFKTGPQPARRVESAQRADDPELRPSGPVAQPSFDPTDMIADIFDATQELLMDSVPDPRKVAEKLLDLALEKVPADAGTFYLADVNGHELLFAAVRGPKADAIKKSGFTVPVGQGIVGFAAQEGVCLVIRDMQHDSRYFRAIADAVGYQPRDTLCASAEKDGRLFGAIQLINAKGEGGFSAGQMEVIRYIGLTAADMLERVADSA